jgi:ABC-type phosphate transport system auxiliary subunit
MSLTIETELKDVLAKIDQRLERIEQGQNELKLDVSELKGEVKNLSTELKGEIKTLSTELKGEIKTLDTKVDGLSTRVSNQELLLRTIVGGLVLIILGGAAKMFWNFPVNP